MPATLQRNFSFGGWFFNSIRAKKARKNEINGILKEKLLQKRRRIKKITSYHIIILPHNYYKTFLRPQKVPKEEIAGEIGYETRKSVYEIRAKALRKFAVRLFGLAVVKVV